MEAWILPTVIGCITGVISYLTKRSIDSIDQKILSTNKRIDDLSTKLDQSNFLNSKAIEELKSEFYEYKDKANEDFARRSDLIMLTSDLNKKVEKVYDILLDIKGRLRS